MTSRINKSTAVGAIAACAVIGATSPVWADNGPGQATNGSPNVPAADTAQDAAVIATLRAEIAKLEAQLHAEGVALEAATRTAARDARALDAARAAVDHWRAVAEQASAAASAAAVPAVDTTTVTPTDLKTRFDDDHRFPCHHHHGDFRDHDDFGHEGFDDHGFDGHHHDDFDDHGFDGHGGGPGPG